MTERETCEIEKCPKPPKTLRAGKFVCGPHAQRHHVYGVFEWDPIPLEMNHSAPQEVVDALRAMFNNGTLSDHCHQVMAGQARPVAELVELGR